MGAVQENGENNCPRCPAPNRPQQPPRTGLPPLGSHRPPPDRLPPARTAPLPRHQAHRSHAQRQSSQRTNYSLVRSKTAGGVRWDAKLELERVEGRKGKGNIGPGTGSLNIHHQTNRASTTERPGHLGPQTARIMLQSAEIAQQIRRCTKNYQKLVDMQTIHSASNWGNIRTTLALGTSRGQQRYAVAPRYKHTNRKNIYTMAHPNSDTTHLEQTNLITGYHFGRKLNQGNL